MRQVTITKGEESYTLYGSSTEELRELRQKGWTIEQKGCTCHEGYGPEDIHPLHCDLSPYRTMPSIPVSWAYQLQVGHNAGNHDQHPEKDCYYCRKEQA